MNTLAFDEIGRCICSVNDHITDDNFPGASFVVRVSQPTVANDVFYDIEAGEVRQRAPLTYLVGPNQIARLPPGTKAVVDGEILSVDDGTLELEVTYPQLVRVRLMHVRFFDAEVEVPCESAG